MAGCGSRSRRDRAPAGCPTAGNCPPCRESALPADNAGAPARPSPKPATTTVAQISPHAPRVFPLSSLSVRTDSSTPSAPSPAYDDTYAPTHGRFRLKRISQAVEHFLSCGDYSQGIPRIRGHGILHGTPCSSVAFSAPIPWAAAAQLRQERKARREPRMPTRILSPLFLQNIPPLPLMLTEAYTPVRRIPRDPLPGPSRQDRIPYPVQSLLQGEPHAVAAAGFHRRADSAHTPVRDTVHPPSKSRRPPAEYAISARRPSGGSGGPRRLA